jgi:hypothetical protein
MDSSTWRQLKDGLIMNDDDKHKVRTKEERSKIYTYLLYTYDLG